MTRDSLTFALFSVALVLAVLQFMFQRIEERVGAFDAHAAGDPAHARALVEAGLYGEARQAFERLAESRHLSPEDRAGVVLSLGELHERHLGAPRRALACYLRATFLAPGSPEARAASARVRALESRRIRD